MQINLVFKVLILQTRVRIWGWEIIRQQHPTFVKQDLGEFKL